MTADADAVSDALEHYHTFRDIFLGLLPLETTEARTALINELEDCLMRVLNDGLLKNAHRLDTYGPFIDPGVAAPPTLDFVVYTRGVLPRQSGVVRHGNVTFRFIDLNSVYAERDLDAWLGRLTVLLGVEDFVPYTVWRQGMAHDPLQ